MILRGGVADRGSASWLGLECRAPHLHSQEHPQVPGRVTRERGIAKPHPLIHHRGVDTAKIHRHFQVVGVLPEEPFFPIVYSRLSQRSHITGECATRLPAQLRCTWTELARHQSSLLVGLTSVANGDNANSLLIVVNRVDYAIITYSDSPEMRFSRELSASFRAWFFGESFDRRKDSLNQPRR